MTTRMTLIVSILLTAAAAAYFGWAYASLPDQVPSHWNLRGEVDGWMAKQTAAWLWPAAMLGLMAFALIAQWLSPRGWDVEPFRPTFNVFMVLAIGLIAYVWVVSTRSALSPGMDGGRLLVGGILVFIAVMGNFLGKLRKNFWVGIRLPWTLADERVWIATHRLGARVLMAAGLLGAAAVIAGVRLEIVFGLLILAVLVPSVYSFVLYKRLHSRQAAPPAAGALLIGVVGVAIVAATGSAFGQPIAEEVRFAGAGGLELRGTLLLPERPAAGDGETEAGLSHKSVPGVLLLPGSGPPDRDGNVKPVLVTDVLKQIAEALAAEGIASLRFDKRSVAVYAPQWPAEIQAQSEFFCWESFAGDALAGYRYLRGRAEVDAARAGVIGHSEGGLIALQLGHDLAGTEEEPAALVLLATAGRRLDDVVRNQIRDGLERQQAAEQIVTLYMDATERAIEQVVRDGTVPGDLPPGLSALFNPSSAAILRAYFTIDPVKLAAAYPGPVLVLQGEMDVQVLAEKDAPRLEEALRGRDKGEVEVVIVPSTSHNLKRVESKEEPGFTGPVVEEAMSKIVGWVKQRLAEPPQIEASNSR